jgi:hypothetical protein
LDFIKQYFLNFWIWWYVINARTFGQNLLAKWNFTLGFLNLVPMLSNLFVPLYQDYSRTGILVSIPIRLVWVVSGTIIQILITIPLVLAYLVYLILPVLPLLAVISFFINFL